MNPRRSLDSGSVPFDCRASGLLFCCRCNGLRHAKSTVKMPASERNRTESAMNGMKCRSKRSHDRFGINGMKCLAKPYNDRFRLNYCRGFNARHRFVWMLPVSRGSSVPCAFLLAGSWFRLFRAGSWLLRIPKFCLLFRCVHPDVTSCPFVACMYFFISYMEMSVIFIIFA